MAAKKSLSNILVWILMAMLILGLGGFGIVNLSGYNSSVATVSNQTVSVNDYARSLQNAIRATEAEDGAALTFAQAQARGIDQQVLGQLITGASLDDEAQSLGISVGDEVLGREIRNMQTFRGPDGQFSRDTYDFALEQMGLRESEFESDVRRDTARSLLQAAVTSGDVLPDTYARTILDWAGQERDVTWALLDRDALETGVPTPTEADLQSYYDANPEAFTAPETRRITYVWLRPDMIIDTVEVDEASLRAAYDERLAEYSKPERRLVERLILGDQEEAKRVRAQIDGGLSFDDAVRARGLDLADVDLGDVTQDDLGGAGEAVFAAQSGDVVGPLVTDLGPALFRVNAILAAQTTTFDEAEAELRDELAGDRARRVIEQQMESLEDLLAGGATLEDLARDTNMELGQIDWTREVTEDIAGYEAFREAAAKITVDDYPEVAPLDDDGLFALRLDAIIPPTLQPLTEVREAVEDGWTQHTITTALNELADDYVARLSNGASFDELGLSTESAAAVTRSDPLADAFPGAAEALFDMSEGDYSTVAADGRALILHLNSITVPDTSTPESQARLQLVNAQGQGSLANDLFVTLINDIRNRVDVSVDSGAINSVNTSFR